MSLETGFTALLDVIAGGLMTHALNLHREKTWLKITSFESFRKRFFEDPDMKVIVGKKMNRQDLTGLEVESLLGFFEEVGIYRKLDLVNFFLLDEMLGDFILECYDDVELRKHIEGVRVGERDNSYFQHFLALGAELDQAKRRRK